MGDRETSLIVANRFTSWCNAAVAALDFDSEKQNMHRLRSSLVAVFVILWSSLGARADVKLPPFFSDHMVLQREGKAAVWGTAAPEETISVRYAWDMQRTWANLFNQAELPAVPFRTDDW
jgi:hypothetical protein